MVTGKAGGDGVAGTGGPETGGAVGLDLNRGNFQVLEFNQPYV